MTLRLAVLGYGGWIFSALKNWETYLEGHGYKKLWPYLIHFSFLELSAKYLLWYKRSFVCLLLVFVIVNWYQGEIVTGPLGKIGPELFAFPTLAITFSKRREKEPEGSTHFITWAQSRDPSILRRILYLVISFEFFLDKWMMLSYFQKESFILIKTWSGMHKAIIHHFFQGWRMLWYHFQERH